jgi:ubiquinone/menaquinone biosynthesis C-methylase UbiE
MNEIRDQVCANWSESAAFWDKHRSARQAMFDPIVSALRDEARIPQSFVDRPYQVLDIAAGPGDLAISLAEKLGQKATLWCTDLVPDMVKIAARSAAERELLNIRFRECPAEELPFDSNLFDAVVCRFGIMFFSDPVAGVRESLRVLKPGCRVAHCVWGTRQANPFHHVVQDVLDKYVQGPAVDPNAPGAFRFAAPGKLKAIFQEAQAADIHERVFNFNIAAPLPFEQFFESRTEMSDSLRAKLRKLPEDQKTRFKADVQQNALAYFSSSGFSFPSDVLLVSGAKQSV